VPVVPTPEMLSEAEAALPELPAARAERYEREWELPTDTARLLAFEPPYGEFFESAVGGDGAEPRALANWVTDLRARIGAETDPRESKVTPDALAKLVGLVQARTINAGAGRQVLDRLVAEGGDPQAIVEREGLAAMGAGDELADIVAKVIAENPDVVERIRGGNPKAMGALVGPVMRETKGRADGGEVNRLIREQLGV
jgi:aspartyl-tRNA(Asn)/glutamyl-tRNA(Gln) amidotransferase subunit B